MIKRIFYILLFFIIGSIIYLNFIGISTSKLNKKIQTEIRDKYPQINLKLNDIKILLNISKLSIDLETDYPIILLENEIIKLKKISTTYELKSFLKREFAIKYLFIDSQKNQIKEITKLARSYKDSAQLLIIEKIVKTGEVQISIKLNFDKNGVLKDDKYEIIADVENLSIDFFNKQKIEKISGNLKYSENKIQITNLESEYKGLELLSKKILISKKNQNYIVEGTIDSKENIVPKSIINIFIKNENIKNIHLSSKNNFNFNLSKKFKISDLKFNSKINLKKAEYEDERNIKKYFPNYDNKITFLDQTLNINFEKKILIEGFGGFQVGEKLDDVKYNFEINKKDIKFDINLDISEIPFKIDLINFAKTDNEVAKLKIVGEKKNNNFFLNKIILKKNNDIIKLNNIYFSKNFQITDFQTINLKYLDIDNKKNDISIVKSKKNSYIIEGNSFNLNKIIDQILFDNTNETKIFDNKERIFDLKFKKNFLDSDHHILNLQGNIKLNGNDVYDMSLKSSFPNKDTVSITVKTKNGQKVTTFYSDQAKPFVKKYKFVKGFEGGKIDFYSVKENKVSKSQLKIFEFSLKELPALTKILTLASLQGIADILSGEGVGFDELEMNFTNKKNLMEIDELYAIGPAISILMEGYVEKNKILSLRGTLVPATTINKFVGSIPILGDILVGKKTGEGIFGVSFKLKGPPKNIKTTVNPIKTLTPRFITRTLEKIKKTN
tara:strand:+ start:247 stop:2421 length:2175 start_codon:yes stop_codon:yes gene_type:complete